MAVIQDTDISIEATTYSTSPNPHDVAVYKMTSDGKSEIMGPVTLDAFRSSPFYKAHVTGTAEGAKDLIPIYTPAESHLQRVMWAEAVNFEKSLGVNSQAGDQANSNVRILIQSEGDEKDGMKAKKILVGHYEEHPVPEDKTKAGATEDRPGKQVSIDAIYDLETQQKINIQSINIAFTEQDPRGPLTPLDKVKMRTKLYQSALVVPLSSEGALMQPEVDKLVAKLHDLPDLDITIPQKAKDGTLVQMTFYPSFTNTDILMAAITGPLEVVPDNADYLTRQTIQQRNFQKKDASEGKFNELITQITGGNFDRVLILTPAAADAPTRILMGNKKETGAIDHVTGQPVLNITFTKSFNAENGKTSFLETPIEMPIITDVYQHHTRQKNIDDVVEKVQKAVEKHEISRAETKSVSDHPFEALVPKGLSSVIQHDSGQHQDDQPVVAKASPVVVGKKVASVA